ncbi:MAG: hypothetical protein ACRDTE_31485 [Pseudonocardiaceae bacterium]
MPDWTTPVVLHIGGPQRIHRPHLAPPDRHRAGNLPLRRRARPVDSGLCNPAFKYRSPALVEGGSLAYLTLHGPDPDATERRWQLGAIGHGPPEPSSPSGRASCPS